MGIGAHRCVRKIPYRFWHDAAHEEDGLEPLEHDENQVISMSFLTLKDLVDLKTSSFG